MHQGGRQEFEIGVAYKAGQIYPNKDIFETLGQKARSWDDQMARRPDDWMIRWPDGQKTGWPKDLMARSLDDQITR